MCSAPSPCLWALTVHRTVKYLCFWRSTVQFSSPRTRFPDKASCLASDLKDFSSVWPYQRSSFNSSYYRADIVAKETSFVSSWANRTRHRRVDGAYRSLSRLIISIRELGLEVSVGMHILVSFGWPSSNLVGLRCNMSWFCEVGFVVCGAGYVIWEVFSPWNALSIYHWPKLGNAEILSFGKLRGGLGVWAIPLIKPSLYICSMRWIQHILN